MSSGEQEVRTLVPDPAGARGAGEITRYLDLRGLPRPLPVAIASSSLREMDRGQLLCVLTSDAAAVADFQQLARSRAKLHLVSQQPAAEGHVHILRRRLA